MRVSFNLLTYDPTSGGYATYIADLFRGFASIESPFELQTLIPDFLASEAPVAGKVTGVRLPKSKQFRYFGEQVYLSSKSSRALGVLHSPFSNPQLGYHGLQVVTLHDVIPVVFPEYVSPFSRRFFSFLWKNGLRRVDAIITVSQWSKKDIVERFGLNEERVHVVYNAFPRIVDFRQGAENTEGVLTRYGINKPYILFVGRLESRKNVPTLVKAFDRVRKSGLTDFLLVLVGKKGWGYEQTFASIESLGLQEHVRVLEHIPWEDLMALYRGASVFVFPSLYEGFGLPPLEAMAFGVPVVASNATSIPEVVGDAGILVDPMDDEALASNVIKVLTDTELRAELVRKGLEQVRLFTIERMAEATVEVYRLVTGD
ncbi:glycosyltransferase family 4 protein [Coprothermobacteraceae bacterium]|nr:glycosyltransferase family 4 protein [Coprothermobacteraceae bacterium]